MSVETDSDIDSGSAFSSMRQKTAAKFSPWTVDMLCMKGLAAFSPRAIDRFLSTILLKNFHMLAASHYKALHHRLHPILLMAIKGPKIRGLLAQGTG